MLTSELFEAYLACPTKAFLLSIGEAPLANDYAGWSQATSDGHRCQGIVRLFATVPHASSAKLDAHELKNGSWQVAIDQLVRAHRLESRIHAIQRVPFGGPSKVSHVVPIRFSSANKVSRAERMMAAFDAFVLSKALGQEMGTARIVHGGNWSIMKVKTAALSSDVTKAINKAVGVLSAASPPPLNLNAHCSACQFQTRCRKKAIEVDDLSLLVSLTAKEKAHLNGKGIFTVSQLSYTFRPRRRAKRLATVPEKYHHSLRARAVREQKVHVVGRPQIKIEGTPVYFDVEGIPDRDFYYLIGLRVGSGGQTYQQSLWADTAEDEQQIWNAFLKVLCTIDRPVLIHYGSFETRFLKQMRTRYGGPPDGSTAAAAMEHPINILTAIFAKIYFPSYSNGLKENARFLGFKWKDPSSSGLQSIVWRHRWEGSRDPTIREKLITYNADDCAALGIIAEAVGRLATHVIEAGDRAPSEPEIVDAELLNANSASKWRAFKSPISDLEKINSAAHWSYQRDRVFVRSGLGRKRTGRRPKVRGLQKKSAEITIALDVPDACPKCGTNRRKQSRLMSRTVQDLVFGRSSIKRRIVQYVVQTYCCRHCCQEYGLRGLRLHGRDWGWNVVAYFVYHVIGLSVPQLTMQHSLNRLFGFALVRSTLNNMKSKASDSYSVTRRKILDRIVGGNLIHADETRANIRGHLAYVWVLTNIKEVVYFLADNREGAIVQELLKNFGGVLVTDFYAAYESIACPQQKCLIHLMRDLNDELLKNPFNEETRSITKNFAVLLKSIVETIDRRGLKKYFLHKHLSDVERFYRFLAVSEFNSDAAVKCKQRFEKNHDTLFTFLRHDGIPWNNNNAEHAIKAFARLRDVISGSSTKKGVEEYLTLLSVSETCRYRGVDFLDFLRSGETDIELFGKAR